MQHTNCALADQSDDDVRARLADAGVDGVDDWEFLAMPDPDAALAADVALRAGVPAAARRACGSRAGATTSAPAGSCRIVPS